MAYTCIKHIKHPLSVCDEVNFFVLCLPLPSILPWSHLSISWELKKKKEKKERTLKRPLSITSCAFLVCWSLSKQAIRILLSSPFKGFYLWQDRNDNVFCWASRKKTRGERCVWGWGSVILFQIIPHLFSPEKRIFDLKAGLNDAPNTKRK